MKDEYYEKRLMGQLQILETVYHASLNLCDPVTYAAKMQDLIHTMAEVMLLPLKEKQLAEISKLPKKIKGLDPEDFYYDEVKIKFPKKKKVKK